LRCAIASRFSVNSRSIDLRTNIFYAADEQNDDAVVDASESVKIGRAREWTPISTFDPPLHFSHLGAQARRRQNYRFVIEAERLRRRPIPKTALSVLSVVNAFRRSFSYYSASQFTNPARCPSSFEIDEDGDLVGPQRLQSHHTRFIFDLYSLRGRSEKEYQAYEALVGRQGLNLVRSFHWRNIETSSSTIEVRTGGRISTSKRKRILVVPSVAMQRGRLSFNQLSEGTFRTLALIFYLVTDKSGLLMIEEPEVCVHHGLLASVIQLIQAQSRLRQIVLSTHSDVVLDSVKPEEVLAVTMRKGRGTVAEAMTDRLSGRGYQALKEFLRESGSLGEYWRQGQLEA
jgi:hypothetical protein